MGHRPERSGPKVFCPEIWLLLGLLLAIRLVLAAWLPLSADEAYYWVWSKALAGGYPDHPPMVALWIRAGTSLFGDTPLAIRSIGTLSAGIGSLVLAQAAEDLAPGQDAPRIAVWLLNATLLMNAGAVLITPDTPLLFFWTLALAALARLIRTGNAFWWLAVGLAGGLALASKYTAFLLGGGILAWLVLCRPARIWWTSWQLWVGGLLAPLILTPVLAWNAAHGWASFMRQGGRIGDWHPALAAKFVTEFATGQIGLATPWVFALLCLGVWRAAKAGRLQPNAALLACVTLVPALVFLQHAFGDRVQANWPSVIYPGASLAAAGFAPRYWRPAAAVGLVIVIAVYLQASFALVEIPGRLDVTAIRLAGWPELADSVEVVRRHEKADFVTTDEYGLAAALAFRLPGEVVGVEPRWALFALPHPDIAGRRAILIISTRRHAGPDPRIWSAITDLGQVERGRAGVAVETYRLFAVTGRALAAGSGVATARLPLPV